MKIIKSYQKGCWLVFCQQLFPHCESGATRSDSQDMLSKWEGKKSIKDRHTTLHYALHSNFRFLRMLVCFLSCDVTRNKPKKYLRWKDLPKKTMFKGLNKDFIWVLNLWKTLPLSDDQWKHPNVFILEVETGVGQYQWTVRASPECHCGLTNLIRTLIMVNMEGKKQVQI